MYYLPFESLIKELAERWTGSQIALNGQNSCEIRTEDGLSLSLSTDPEKPVIQAVFFLGIVPRSDESIPLFLSLLRENREFYENGIFGIDIKNQRFTLHESIPFENLDIDKLSHRLIQLHQKAFEWAEIIEGKKPIPR